jgi:hypothetical protein
VTFKKDPKEVRGRIFQFSVAMEKYLRWVMYEEEIYLTRSSRSGTSINLDLVQTLCRPYGGFYHNGEKPESGEGPCCSFITLPHYVVLLRTTLISPKGGAPSDLITLHKTPHLRDPTISQYHTTLRTTLSTHKPLEDKSHWNHYRG